MNRLSTIVIAFLCCVFWCTVWAGETSPLRGEDVSPGKSGAVRLPDLEPVDLYRVGGRLKVALLNHGFAFTGEVELRLAALESVVSGARDFVLDRMVVVPITIGTGAVAVVDIGSLDWPNEKYPALDHPQLRVGVRVDPQGRIPERSQSNNSIERTLRVPCGVIIESAVRSHFQEGLPALLELHGRFGSAQKTKGVVLRSDGRASSLLVADWRSDALKVVLPNNIPAGRYDVVVECTEKICGQGYFTSNALEIFISGEKTESKRGNEEDRKD